MKKMGGSEGAKIRNPEISADLGRKLTERKKLINDVLQRRVQKVRGFYLHTLKELDEPMGVSYIGLTYPQPYVGMSESGAMLNFILEIEKMGLVICEKQREGEAYRYTYRIVEKYHEPLRDLLVELGL